MNPATKVLQELGEAARTENRTKKYLAPVTKADKKMCEDSE